MKKQPSWILVIYVCFKKLIVNFAVEGINENNVDSAMQFIWWPTHLRLPSDRPVPLRYVVGCTEQKHCSVSAAVGGCTIVLLSQSDRFRRFKMNVLVTLCVFALSLGKEKRRRAFVVCFYLILSGCSHLKFKLFDISFSKGGIMRSLEITLFSHEICSKRLEMFAN